ncbi:MAG: SBBP repeat-containing protein, partial [Bacteroidia bacterium]
MLFANLFASNPAKTFKAQYGFIENKGQIVDQNNQLNKDVLFLYNSNGFKVQLKKNGFSYEVIKTVRKAKIKNPEEPEFMSSEIMDDITFYVHRIDITFEGGNENAKITSYERSSDYINYYSAVTPEEGVKNVRHYKRIVYQNLYPNIDVEFYLSPNPSPKERRTALRVGKVLSLGEDLGEVFKYNFVVHPGGNVNDIQLKFDGANQTALTKEGHITVETAYGNIDESIPLTYQLDEKNIQQKITSNFKLVPELVEGQTTNLYGISVGNYDATKILVIDPLPWATYYGGSLSDYGIGLNVDVYGNLLFAGTTVSTSAVATSGAFQTTYGGGTQDGLIVKFDSRDTLKWATYYGGTLADVCGAVKTDSIGNIYVSGYSQSTSGIATAGSFKPTASGNYDCFLVKFDSTGARLWGTYYGCTGNDLPYYNCIALDKASNIFMVGVTNSTGYQMSTTGAFKTYMLTSGDAYDAFLVK